MPVSKFRSESKQTDEINNSRSNSSNSHRSWCFIYHGKEKEMKSIPNNRIQKYFKNISFMNN